MKEESTPRPPDKTLSETPADRAATGAVGVKAAETEASKLVESNGDNVRASWNFSLHQVRHDIAYYAAETKELLISAFLWCTDPKHEVDRQDFARRVGYDSTTIWKIYRGKYRNGAGDQLEVPQKLVKAIRSFLALERERFGIGKTAFVLTPTAKKIFKLCDLARESQTPAFMFGPSHVGKSEALEAYTAGNNHGRTVYVRMRAATGLGGMVKQIARCIGISDNSNTANLVDYIIRALTPDMLLIFDEIHLLSHTYRKESFFSCLEVLREIYDTTHCGMVFCGTKLMMDKIEGAQHAELEQLLARGVHRLALTNAPTKADLAAIFQSVGLEFPDRKQVVEMGTNVTDSPYDVIRQLAHTQRLKAITERLRYARKFASQAQEKIGWIHFLRAHNEIAAQARAADQDQDQW